MNDRNVTHNSATNDSTVGIQAETVHNSNVYFVHPDASPQEKYRVGIRLLEDGISGRAREMITDVIAHGNDHAEVRFHWVLAMLSTRAFHDLNAEEIKQLHHASRLVRTYAGGEWKDALRITFELLAMLSTAQGDTALVLKRLRALPARQREGIIRHLDLVLAGGLKDSLWAENRERAETERFGNDRVHRIWAYFEPDPIGPRALPPRASTAATAQAAFRVRAGMFVIAGAFLWITALLSDPAEAVIELLVALCAGLTATHFGRQWCFRDHQPNVETEPHVPHIRTPASTRDGFTERVRRSFDHYFAIRAPHGLGSDEWLEYSSHVRNSLAAEIALLYRESRISVERVNWLIRYLAEDTRNRHNSGTLLGHRCRNRNAVMAHSLFVITLAILGITALSALGTAASGGGAVGISLAVLAVAGTAWSGYTATSSWLAARREENRLVRETQEYHERLSTRQIAYENWKSFLDTKRPSEQEMENWLTCDKTLFIDEALRHYQLTWRDLITHTILVTPARPYKRGRAKHGPWRYSRYSFRLFLVTQDGVREISAEIDFTEAKRGNEQRSNYRFEALSSVQVTESTHAGYELELVLTNGPARSIRVKDADAHQLAPDENAQEVAEINLNAAGFIHAFRLLEGIAADGKGWIERNNPNNLPSFDT
ncbi:hypothetical protein ACWGHM_11710 [Streptomyces sp. NPDC054904]